MARHVTKPHSSLTDSVTLKALEAFMACDSLRLPSLFYDARFLMWSTRMLNLRGQDANYMKAVAWCSAGDTCKMKSSGKVSTEKCLANVWLFV